MTIIRSWLSSLCLVFGVGSTPFIHAKTLSYLETQKQALIQELIVEGETYEVAGLQRFSDKVIEAIRNTPREAFVSEQYQSRAYLNQPLPIGYGQTISQPYIVALMTELIKPKPEHIVLEVGTGSGYQAAVLAPLVKTVYSVEIIPPLATSAKAALQKAELHNVITRTGDGYLGWEEAAPFDAIIVTAAASHIPPPLIKQLKPGGIMVIPVGAPLQVQQLVLVKKDPQGKVTTRQLLPVMFVPLTRGANNDDG